MTNKKYRRGRAAAALMAVMVAMAGVAGCAGQDSQETVTESSAESETAAETESISDSQVDMEFSDRDMDGTYSETDEAVITLNGSQAEASGNDVTVSGSTVTISGEGTFIVTGTLDDGQIVVDAGDSDKVQIVLKDADIHSETSAAIYVKSADKVFVTLAGESTAKLSGGTEYVDTDDNTVDGVIFSKSDLTVNGSGTLEISANYKHGIVSKDTLAITGGALTIDAVSQCLSAKDGLKIADGTFQLTTQGKAVKAENEEDSALGNIYVAGGTFTVNSEDDAFHTSGSLIIDGGMITVETGDDAFHADQDLVVNGGTLKAVSCYEGLEGHRVTVNGGDITITASDDGVNAADPDASSDGAQGGGLRNGSGEMAPQGQMPAPMGEDGAADGESQDSRPQRGKGMDGGGMGGGGMENDTDAYIKITGGTLTVDAGGDGLDSNGSLTVSGGTIYVSGSEGGADSAIDYNGEAVITGGTIIAAGSAGMAQGFGDSSAQYSILNNFSSSQEAGSTVTLTDKDGKILATWAPQKKYTTVVVSTPDLKEGSTYTLTAGTESAELTLESAVTSNMTSGGGFGGGMGQRGQRPDQNQDQSQSQERNEDQTQSQNQTQN